MISCFIAFQKDNLCDGRNLKHKSLRYHQTYTVLQIWHNRINIANLYSSGNLVASKVVQVAISVGSKIFIWYRVLHVKSYDRRW